MRKFAEGMLAKGSKREATSLLQMIDGSLSETHNIQIDIFNPDSQIPADKVENLRVSSQNENLNTLICSKSNTSSKHCLISVKGQINPSLASESASFPSNVESKPATAPKNSQCSIEGARDVKDLELPDTDKCKKSSSLEAKGQPTQPVEASCEIEIALSSGQKSCKQRGETASAVGDTSTECKLVCVSDDCVESKNFEEAFKKQEFSVHHQNVFSDDSLFNMNEIIENEIVKVLTDDATTKLLDSSGAHDVVITPISVITDVPLKTTSKCESQCSKNQRPPAVVAPLNQKITETTPKREDKVERPRTEMRPNASPSLAPAAPVRKPIVKEVAETQQGPSGVKPSPLGSKQATKPLQTNKTKSQQAKSNTYQGSRHFNSHQKQGNNKACRKTESKNPSNSRRNFYSGNVPQRHDPRRSLLPLPPPLLAMRGLRPVYQPHFDVNYDRRFYDIQPDDYYYFQGEHSHTLEY